MITLKNKSILITGGTGFFGKNLCLKLQSLGATVYAMARTPANIPGINYIKHDITQAFSFDKPIDYIIHAATPVTNENGDFEKTMNIIVNGTQEILKFAEQVQCEKFLLISSGAVYGEQPVELRNIPENYIQKDPFYDVKSAYATGKRISELMAHDWSLRTKKNLTVARCFAFSGAHLPLDQHLAIGNFLHDALTKKEILIKGDGKAIRSYMDADDLTHWLLTILLHGKNGEAYNIGSDQEISMKELAEKIAQKVPGTKVIIQNSNPNGKRNRYIPSIEKAKKELNLKINISLEESIQKMIDFNKGKI